MTQEEKLTYLLEFLLAENPQSPFDLAALTAQERRRMLRGLMNIRPAWSVTHDFLDVQDAFLQEELRGRGVVDGTALPTIPGEPGISLWRGDITTLKVDAIVNAANSGLLGCFIPCHGCIDNAIHSYAGIQLRLECDVIMKAQGHPEPTGKAKLTRGYNLPGRHVLHTVGPIIGERVRDEDRNLLADCYKSCLALATENGIKTIAFCCISTGEFRFPKPLAAEIAIGTVRDYLMDHEGEIKVIFNVFTEQDYAIYSRLLSAN